jgi:hypothetical protein
MSGSSDRRRAKWTKPKQSNRDQWTRRQEQKPHMHNWMQQAREELMKRRGGSGVWGYRCAHSPSVEATVLACLGYMACWGKDPPKSELAVVRKSADWLLRLQRSDGSLGVSPMLPEPGWTTPYAVLLWNALQVHKEARRRAAAWLLDQKGVKLPPEMTRKRIAGHDLTLVGWPWIKQTSSWLEPTSMAILALTQEGLGDHPRVSEGVLLITDRALDHGGWNYGNKAVFGRELRPQPGPTGLALLASAAARGKVRPRTVDPAIAYLRQTLPGLRAPMSLGWGVLGLRAWSACPEEADAWLSQSFALHIHRRDATAELGLLLLAAGETPPPPFGPRVPAPAASSRPVATSQHDHEKGDGP